MTNQKDATHEYSQFTEYLSICHLLWHLCNFYMTNCILKKKKMYFHTVNITECMKQDV